MSDGKKDETSSGGLMGFQVPPSIGAQKDRVRELMGACPDLKPAMLLAFFSSLAPEEADDVAGRLGKGDLEEVADCCREFVVREIVRKRMGEVVRKKPGGGGYVLYVPNPGKKKGSKPAGTFPTKLAAKRAELTRFPPRDPKKRSKLQKSIQRMTKRVNAGPVAKREQVEEAFLWAFVRSVIAEGMAKTGRGARDWDAHLDRFEGGDDKKLDRLQKNIVQKTHDVLEDALTALSRALKKAGKFKPHGVKDDGEQPYASFEIDMDGVPVGPVRVVVQQGTPRIDVTDQAKMSLSRVDPASAKALRGELLSVQEGILDGVPDLKRAVQERDRYLEKVEKEVDRALSSMSPLQLSMIKNLLNDKQRKTR